MIAHRFRPVVWVVGCAFAATALYTVSLGVASERTKLEDLNQEIARTERDIRQLQTEMGTRASLRQLERWNGDVLALTAPKAGQFRATEAALKSIDGNALPSDSFAPPPVMVAAATRTTPPSTPAAVSATAASATKAVQTAAVVKAERPQMATTKVAEVKPAETKPAAGKQATTKVQRFAMLDRALVDKRTLNEIMVRAENESRTGGGKGKIGQ